MKNKILEIINALDFDSRLIDQVESMKFKDNVKENPYHDLENVKAQNEFNRFVLSLYALVFVKEDYDKQGIPSYIFTESMEDLNLRAISFFENNDAWGIRDVDLKWLNMLLNFKLFKLHSLRFQIFPMDYTEMEREGEDFLNLKKEIKAEFPEGTPLINVHIETDANLSPKAVDKSLILAQAFFNEFFPEYKPEGFITRTWLLHPALKELLPEESNILMFANRFRLIGISNNFSQALIRIYGTRDLEKIKVMEKESSLQKKAYAMHHELGVGIGYLEMKGNLNDKSSLPKILRQ